MDEEDILSNCCADLVSETRFESALVHLFGAKAAGEWVSVAELYRLAGLSTEGIKPELFAGWLPSPNTPGYSIVLFFVEDSLWSMTAWYNVARLRESHPATAVAVA